MWLFSKLFGGHNKNESCNDKLDEIRKEIAGSLNIMDAINAHVKWKMRLDNYLRGTSEEKLDAAVVSRDDQCVLGKWIHGKAHEYFHDSPGLHELTEDHARFHKIAGQIINRVQTKDIEAAELLLKGDYSQASRKVILDLTHLGKSLGHDIDVQQH